MIGSMPNGMRLLEPIPDGWKVLSLQLPVNVSDLGTWCVPGLVRNPEGQVVWKLLKVQGSQPLNTGLRAESG